MSLRSRMVQEFAKASHAHVLDLKPQEVSRIVRDVLGVDGAGITLFHPLVRLPVAATDADAQAAEQLQVTLGHGPCLEAAETGRPCHVDEPEIREKWPLYHAELIERTPYRSVVCLPLRRAGGETFGALDTYGRGPRLSMVGSLDTVQADVGDLVAMMLTLTLTSDDERHEWPPAELRRRQNVWVAIGMVMEAAATDDLSALALLRAHAFRRELLLDELADQMVTSGHVDAHHVLAGDDER